MLFSSFEFLFRFLPVFLVIYYLTPKKLRNVTLLGGSIVFYTIGEAGYITILLACVLVNYTLTRLMYRKNTDGRGIRQKRLLLLALGYDLGVLFFFKYSGLASGLPLGISFYTFQIMAYVIDVYRGRIPAEQSLLRLGTYLTMFPQLISGPITNYADVRVALGRERTIKARQLEEGMKLLIIGLAAKVVIADRIGTLWNSIRMIGFDSISTKLAWMGAFAYSLQLYFDFAGYSMMARGIGKMLGFELPVNFRYPTFQNQSRNSGADGILRSADGLGNMYTFRWEATGRERRAPFSICLWCGALPRCGTGRIITSWSGAGFCFAACW